VVLVKDFMSLTAFEPVSGATSELSMPDTSDVLQFFSKDGSKVSIRPSGTEPKIKFYIEVRGEMKRRDDYEKAVSTAEVKIKAVMRSLGL
jgi:phosphoglucomutase